MHMHLSYQRMKGKKGLPLFPYFGVVELGVLAELTSVMLSSENLTVLSSGGI